jgi:hypothetical protein
LKRRLNHHGMDFQFSRSVLHSPISSIYDFERTDQGIHQ